MTPHVNALTDFTPPPPIEKKKRAKRRARRRGTPTQTEQALMEQLLRQKTSDVTKRDVQALAVAFDRSPKTIAKMVSKARETFAGNAERYVSIHMEAAEGALAAGDHETAASAAQWAMKEISMEGTRIIDRANEAVQVPRIMIGIKLGGTDNNPALVVAQDAEVVE